MAAGLAVKAQGRQSPQGARAPETKVRPDARWQGVTATLDRAPRTLHLLQKVSLQAGLGLVARLRDAQHERMGREARAQGSATAPRAPAVSTTKDRTRSHSLQQDLSTAAA